jgi:hypothetical protein
MSYRVIKKINGREYVYEQSSFREAGKVKTISRCIGPVEPIYKNTSTTSKVVTLALTKFNTKVRKILPNPVKLARIEFNTTIKTILSDTRVYEQSSILRGEFERVRVGYADKNGLGICYVECFGNKKTKEGHLTIHAGSKTIHKHGICEALSDREAREMMSWAKNKPIIHSRIKPRSKAL